MTVRARYLSRCPFCETTVSVSDWERPNAFTASGRFFLIHAALNVRCPGSGERVEVYWPPGEEPGWLRAGEAIL